jgi:hypothetical protein
MRDALAGLTSLREADVPPDLRSWGSSLASANGSVPLLGLAVRAATYPGLLWNGVRLKRAGLGDAEALTMVGVVSGPDHMHAVDLLRAVRAGLAVAGGLSRAEGSNAPLATPSTAVVAAAACAAIAAGHASDDLVEILDLAGTLMVVAPTRDDAPLEQSLRAGHGLAAGWLTVQLVGAGIVGMPDGLTQTVSTVTGDPAFRGASAELLDELS